MSVLLTSLLEHTLFRCHFFTKEDRKAKAVLIFPGDLVLPVSLFLGLWQSPQEAQLETISLVQVVLEREDCGKAQPKGGDGGTASYPRQNFCVSDTFQGFRTAH